MAPKRAAAAAAKKPTNAKQTKAPQEETISTMTKPSEWEASKDASGRRKRFRNLKQFIEASRQTHGSNKEYLEFNYKALDAPPSIRPRIKYCDITALIAPFVDPKSGLRYHNASVYQHIRTLSHDQMQQHLKLRNAHTEI